MTLFKRHVGRRVATVGVAVALLVLGLEAPAFAAQPTIGASGISPTSGPIGCVVTITGTNFNSPNVTDVEFHDINAASFRIDSATQITAVVGPGTTGTGKVDVTNADGTATSTQDFTVSPTSCPTITSFTPTCAPVGTSVTITGTNLTAATSLTFNNVAATISTNTATQITTTVPATATTGPIRVTTSNGTGSSLSNFTVAACPTITSFTPTFGPTGTSVTITGTNLTAATSVTFNNVAATISTNTATQITTTVPATATTGPIKVTTSAGSATSSTNFTVSKLHSRNVTLSLKKHLVAQGSVSVGDGFTACASNVPVKIQRKKKGGGWKSVGSTTTSASGSYKKKVNDKEGKYRAKATKVTLNSNVDICSGANSTTRKHNH
jgi:IPT/TIG domain